MIWYIYPVPSETEGILLSTAILVDAAFFLRRIRKTHPSESHNDAEVIAELLHAYALLHLKQDKSKRSLYRIFVYDCPPFQKTLTNPISKKQINFSKTPIAKFQNEFHDSLRSKRLVALRLGHIPDSINDWKFISPEILNDLVRGTRQVADIKPEELVPNIRQKGVDMRIGVDISTLALKKQVDQIVLISGDSDFVPAAKLARREGIDFILDPMWAPISPELNEHIDGLISKCKNPRELHKKHKEKELR